MTRLFLRLIAGLGVQSFLHTDWIRAQIVCTLG